jgi:hypothetical protein
VTALERIGLETFAAIALFSSALLWWHLHNLNEQHQGAQACIQQTTETKAAAIRIDATDAIEQGRQLAQVVTTYDAKLQVESVGNALLAQRMRDANPVRHSTVPGASCPAAQAPADRGIPDSESAAIGRLANEYAKLLDACDANQARVEGLAAAYNDWRDRMLKTVK